MASSAKKPTKKPTKKTRLSTKQANFVKGVAQGKTQVQAALDSYDIKSVHKYNTAASIADDNMKKPYIQEAIEVEMVKQGLTMEKIIEPVALALSAKTRLKVKDDDGAMVEVDSPDLDMRLKGHDRAVKLMSFGQKREDPTINNFGQMVVQQRGRYDD